MRICSDAQKRALTNRLRRIEGQLRGIEEMIEKGDDCVAIAGQLSAAKSALSQTLSSLALCAIEAAAVQKGKGDSDAIRKVLKLVS